MFPQVPSDFAATLHTVFETALADGHVQMTPATSTVEHVDGVPYQLLKIESLVHRTEKGTLQGNPFESPEPELTVLPSYADAYRLVLNKFPVVPQHFLMVTQQFALQNSPLTPPDLGAVYALLCRLNQSGASTRWFAFYNCGQELGMLQPHKHVQFMPFPQGFSPFPEQLAHERFLPSSSREPLQHPKVPFAHYIAGFENIDSEDDLGMYYSALMQRTLTSLRDDESVELVLYNVVMTDKWMMMVPRKRAYIVDGDHRLGINLCGTVGLVLTKNQDLYDWVLKEGITSVLARIGFPNTNGQRGNEYHY